jgi:hypothetical protein
LNDETIDNIYNILEAEILESPEILEHLRGAVNEKVVPALKKTR